MTLNDIPLISFCQRLLDPLIMMCTLYCAALGTGVPFNGYMLILMVMAFLVTSAVYQRIDPYRSWRAGNQAGYRRDLLLGWIVTVLILACIYQASGMSGRVDANTVLIWVVATPLLILVAQKLVRMLDGGAESVSQMRSVLIIGANPISLRFAASIDSNPTLQMKVEGYFDDRMAERHPPGMRHPVLGKMAELAKYVREHQTKVIFISQPISSQPRIRELLDELQDTTASVYFLPDIYAFDLMQARFDTVGGMPVIAICESPFTGFNRLIKRGSDIVLALLIQIMLTPIMLVIAAAVKLTSPGPIIFRQRRYGLNGEEILVYKFRSMTVAEDGAKVVQATRNDQRVTRIGGFLRRSSLDELPQFINVLQGRMSIVGPRPHAVAHNEQYRKLIKGYMLRHKAKPGITGWAQVNGLRGETETLDKMEARIRFDLDYLRHWSLWLDLWIVIKTVKVVLKRENAH